MVSNAGRTIGGRAKRRVCSPEELCKSAAGPLHATDGGPFKPVVRSASGRARPRACAAACARGPCRACRPTGAAPWPRDAIRASRTAPAERFQLTAMVAAGVAGGPVDPPAVPHEPALRLGVNVFAMPQVKQLALEAPLRLRTRGATADLAPEHHLHRHEIEGTPRGGAFACGSALARFRRCRGTPGRHASPARSGQRSAGSPPEGSTAGTEAGAPRAWHWPCAARCPRSAGCG